MSHLHLLFLQNSSSSLPPSSQRQMGREWLCPRAVKLTLFPESAIPFLKCALSPCRVFNLKTDLANTNVVFYKTHIGLNRIPRPRAFYRLISTATFFCPLLLLPFLFLLLRFSQTSFCSLVQLGVSLHFIFAPVQQCGIVQYQQ